MKTLIGNIESHPPLAMAEAAIAEAYQTSPRSLGKFALTCGPDRRLYVRRHGANCVYGSRNSGVRPAEWIATFTRKADPDWLADEIAGARL